MYCSSYLVESPGAVLDAPIHVSGAAAHGPRLCLKVVPGATAATAAAAVRGRSPLHL